MLNVFVFGLNNTLHNLREYNAYNANCLVQTRRKYSIVLCLYIKRSKKEIHIDVKNLTLKYIFLDMYASRC